MARIVWILNLDAEDELARLPRAWTRGAEMELRLAQLASRLDTLVGEDLVVGASEILGGENFARPWCPTPSALAAARAAELRCPEAPPWQTLRRVNHRRFAVALGQTLPRAAYVDSSEEALGVLDAAQPAESWILKRPFGYAGRGRRKVWAGRRFVADHAWIAASCSTGEGLLLEPEVDRLLDCALHGYVLPDGEIIIGAPTIQRCDATGAWLESRRAAEGELFAAELDSLQTEAGRVGDALHGAEYFGPFNLDAYRWRDSRGSVRFQPRSEVNARYSMGWGVGMGTFRPPMGLP